MRPALAKVEQVSWVEAVADFVAAAGILHEETERTLHKAFVAVPRENFVASVFQGDAFLDVDVPIGHGQWLTRPSVQLRMLSLLKFKRHMRILELGAGSGYLCAVLVHCGVHVFGVERIVPLAQSTRKHLDRAGFHGVLIRGSEGTKGWEESAPFDAVIASYPIREDHEIPFGQLRQGGQVVAPLSTDNGIHLATWIKHVNRVDRLLLEPMEMR